MPSTIFILTLMWIFVEMLNRKKAIKRGWNQIFSRKALDYFSNAFFNKGLYLILHEVSNFSVKFNRFSLRIWNLPFDDLFKGSTGLLASRGDRIIYLKWRKVIQALWTVRGSN